MLRILGIDTSCDDTSIAVVADGTTILSNVVASQIDVHYCYGGVVPERRVASMSKPLDWFIAQLSMRPA